MRSTNFTAGAQLFIYVVRSLQAPRVASAHFG
eukprot:UN16332